MRPARIRAFATGTIGSASPPHDKDRLPNRPQERQAAPPRSRRKLIQVTQARTPDLAVPEPPPNLVTVAADVPRVQQARGVVRPPETPPTKSRPSCLASSRFGVSIFTNTCGRPGIDGNPGWCRSTPTGGTGRG